MKVTQVALCPSSASVQAGRPALTPELLAATGARYSRNNEGLESILAKIDRNNLDRSVDSIFRMMDYGHQSIADMVPVAMFIDGISIWLAYYVWTLCPTAGGQESSTRYLKISVDGLTPPEKLGIPAEQVGAWRELMEHCFRAYQSSLRLWEELAGEDPKVMGIPSSLLADSSEAAQKKVARMKRNYAFDRARYFLPAAASTNVMLVMSARGWVTLCQNLFSHPVAEAQGLGEAIRAELEIVASRLIKYARRMEQSQRAIAWEFEQCARMAAADRWDGFETRPTKSVLPGGTGLKPVPQTSSAVPLLEVSLPEGASEADIVKALAFHDNRYAPLGSPLQRTSVRFGWSAIGFAEIRDLNRHRTGTKFCPQVPKGFYFSQDQMPPALDPTGKRKAALAELADIGRKASLEARKLLVQREPTYVYWTLLGTEFPFEHLTTADKFIYEAELRTGLGAHFRYAKHLRDVLALWYRRFPESRSLILEGSAEPE